MNVSRFCLRHSRGFANRFALCAVTICLMSSQAADAFGQTSDLKTALQTVLAVKIDGSGSEKAAEAFPTLAAAQPDQLPTMLAALDDANPLAANWIYGSIDAVVSRAAKSNTALPADALETFVKDASHSPRGRERAFMLLQDIEDQRTAALVPGFLSDPSPIFRRSAVAKLLEEAESQAAEGADASQLIPAYEKAYAAALDEDQVNAIAKLLVDAGETVDLPKKFGYLTHWRVIGPFDNPENGAFDKAYPPEQLTLDNYDGAEGINSDVSFEGKLGDVSWKDYATGADNGEVNLNEALAEEKASIGYGATVFTSDQEQPAQLRLRIQNAFKVWLNGEMVMAQPVGHTGNFFDQYTVPVTLRKGANLIVVKSVQIEPPQADPWFSAWQFCVRVSDETGAAILAADRPPTPAVDKAEPAKDGDQQ